MLKNERSDLMKGLERFIVVFSFITVLIATLVTEICLLIAIGRTIAVLNGGSVEYETTIAIELNTEYCDE